MSVKIYIWMEFMNFRYKNACFMNKAKCFILHVGFDKAVKAIQLGSQIPEDQIIDEF